MTWLFSILIFTLAWLVILLGIKTIEISRRLGHLEDVLHWDLIKFEVAKKIGDLFGEKEDDCD